MIYDVTVEDLVVIYEEIEGTGLDREGRDRVARVRVRNGIILVEVNDTEYKVQVSI